MYNKQNKCKISCPSTASCVNKNCVCNPGWHGENCQNKCYSLNEDPFKDNCSKLNGCCNGLVLCYNQKNKNFTCQKSCDNSTKPDCEMADSIKLKNCCSIPEICPSQKGSCTNLTCCELCGNTQKCANIICKSCKQDRCYQQHQKDESFNICQCCSAPGDKINRHICNDGSKSTKCCSGDEPIDNICPVNNKTNCNNGISFYDSCICNYGYEGDNCNKLSQEKSITHCSNYDTNSIFVSHGRGFHGCRSGNGPNLQNIPINLPNGKISGGVYKCGVSDLTLSGGSDNSCIYTTTIGTIDMKKLVQIDFDLFAENCENDWCSLWLDPYPYPNVDNSGEASEIDLVEIMSNQRSDQQQALRTNFGGAYGEYAHQMIWNDIYPINMKNIKKHFTLRKKIINGEVIAYLNICDGLKECPDLDSNYRTIAWINLSKFPIGDPNIPPGTMLKYNIVADIWKTDKSPDGTYSGGSNNATDCKFTIRNLKVKYE